VVLLHGKYIEENSMTQFKLMGYFMLVVFLMFLGYVWWVFDGSKMKCGPSESITKPMAEAIVREINKRGTPNKIVKLDSLENLPYELVECEKEILSTHKYGKKGIGFESKQTCYFNINNQKYSIKLEYDGDNVEANKILMKGEPRLYIYITKADLHINDFTEIRYGGTQLNKEHTRVYKWRLFDSKSKHYSKQSKGDCRYRSPIRP